MKSLTILRYLSENLEDIPLGVTTRFVVTHDVPVLLVQFLEEKPWLRQNKNKGTSQVFVGSEWIVSFKVNDKEKIISCPIRLSSLALASCDCLLH